MPKGEVESEQIVHLDDELAGNEQLKKILPLANRIDLLEEAVEQIDRARPSLRITVRKGRLIAGLHLELPLKKAAVAFAGTVSGVWAVYNFALHNWPAIKQFVLTIGTGSSGP
jgi:hypothetical protein